MAGTPERGVVLAQVRNLLEFARQQGYGHSEIIQMINDLPQDRQQAAISHSHPRMLPESVAKTSADAAG